MKTTNPGRKYCRHLCFIPLLFLFFFIHSCKSSDHKTLVIGFSQCTGEDTWRVSMLEEMKRELSFYPNARLLYKDAAGNSNLQVEQIKELLKEHVDILIVSPNEEEPLTPVVEKAYKEGIPVIVVDRKISSNLYTAFIGGDNYEIGFNAGSYIGNLLKGKGNVIEITGLKGSSPAMERREGFKDAVKRFPDIKIIAEVPGDWLKPIAQSQLQKMNVPLKKASLIFAHNDVMALGAYELYHNRGLDNHVKFVGVDAQPGIQGGIELVSKGILTASLLYPTGGKEAIQTAIEISRKEPVQKENLLQTIVIDSSNVRLMKLQTDKISSQQKDIERQQSLLANLLKTYSNQQTILYILVFTLLLAIILGIILFNLLRGNKRIAQSLRLKNKEILFERNKTIEFANKAKDAMEAKSNFFTNISHEFRTPLTLILGCVDEIIEMERQPGKMKQQMQLIKNNAFRLLRMVNQLIDYRKAEVNKMPVRAAESDLIDFIRSIITSFMGVAKKRKIDLRLISDLEKFTVWFDPDILDKIFFNLISNSFKFTEDYGRVYVRINTDKDKKNMIVEIEDNGIGIPKTELAHIFEPFYQGKNQNGQGFGLGLALARELITLHHGNISVKSEESKGATFTIVLPLGTNHLSPEQKIMQTDISDYQEDFRTYGFTAALEKPAVNADPADNTGYNEQSILIIEDNDDLRNFLISHLKSSFRIYNAADGNEGIKMAFDHIPDLILCDIVIPNKDGYQVCSALKTDIRTSHIPLVLLTARGSTEHQIAGVKSMADYYIIKPFNVRFLDEIIRNLLKSREMLREHYTSAYPVEIKRDSPGKLDKRFLNEFTSMIEQNISNEQLNISDICKHIGISRVQLYRKVKALLGCSVNDYILNVRLRKAKYLLFNEDLTVAEVAYRVGFSSATYFSTVFKSKFNSTPTAHKHKTNKV